MSCATAGKSGGTESQVSSQLRLPPQRTLTRRAREVSLWERQGLRPQERIRARVPMAEGKLQPPAPGRAAPGRGGGPGARDPSARPHMPGSGTSVPATVRRSPPAEAGGLGTVRRVWGSNPHPAPRLATPVNSEAPCPRGFGHWRRWPVVFPSVPLPPQLPSHPKEVQRG